MNSLAASGRKAQLPPRQTGLRERALRLNKRGYRTFPVELTAGADGSLNKKPLIRNYHGEHPFDEAQIHGWPWSKANALGWALPSNMIIIDVDVKNGVDGYRQLEELEELHGRLPETALQETASGGAHLVFEVPAGLKWHDKIPLGASKANIDLCHAGHRYAVIYDDELYEQKIACLPEIWVDALTKDPVGASRSPVRSVGTWPSEVGKLITVLSGAKKGERNNTLNTVVFKLVVDGNWSESIEELVVQTATNLELDDAEIEATIRSAIQGGTKTRERTDSWFHALEKDHLLKKERTSAQLLSVGYALAKTARIHGNDFGMSCRQLAELLGVSPNTASNALLTLKKLGFLIELSFRQSGGAKTYRLQIPERSKQDSLSTNNGRLSYLACAPLGTRLRGHGAFIRVKGTWHLPKSCAAVLEAIAVGAATTAEVVAVTQISASTVRKDFNILEMAGAIKVDPGPSKIVTPYFEDPLDWLAEWSAWGGSDNNADILRFRHQMQREDYRVNRQYRQSGRRLSPSLSMPVIK